MTAITHIYPGASEHPTRQRIYAKIGEFRNPKKGEFFLSGATPYAYKATNDLSTAYHIMREVEEIPPPPKQYRFVEPGEEKKRWSTIHKRFIP